MFDHLRPALVMILALTLLTGLAYPLAVTGSPSSPSRPRPAAA